MNVINRRRVTPLIVFLGFVSGTWYMVETVRENGALYAGGIVLLLAALMVLITLASKVVA